MLYIRTIDEIRSLLEIADTRDDGRLTIWAEGLQGRLASHCRRIFLHETAATELHQGRCDVLYLRHYPTDSVTAITINGTSVAVPTVIDRRRGRIPGGLYGWDEGEIAVTCTGGLIKADGTAAPLAGSEDLATLKRAFDLQLNFEWRNRKILGVSQVSAQGASVQAGAQVTLALKGMTLLPEVESTIHPLRRIL